MYEMNSFWPTNPVYTALAGYNLLMFAPKELFMHNQQILFFFFYFANKL